MVVPSTGLVANQVYQCWRSPLIQVTSTPEDPKTVWQLTPLTTIAYVPRYLPIRLQYQIYWNWSHVVFWADRVTDRGNIFFLRINGRGTDLGFGYAKTTCILSVLDVRM